MPGVIAYLTVGGVAAIATFIATPLARKTAERFGVISAPGIRDVHEIPTPHLGGPAMLFGLLAGALFAWLIGDFSDVFSTQSEILGVLVAAIAMCGVGVIDDVRPISAPAKVAGMVIAGSVLSLVGVSLVVLRVPFVDVVLLSPDLAALATVLWVVLLANAINLIDGLDGLATGIVAIAATTFVIYAIRLANEGVLFEENPASLIAVLIAGVCIGFLPHNAHPAKIFMGDGGALMLGVLLAAATVSVGGRTDAAYSGQSFFFFAPLLIPLVILGVPIIDVLFAIIRRIVTPGLPVTTADKDHLHHRLLRLGHGHRRVVFILWAWTALLSGFVLWPTYSGRGDGIVPMGIAGVCLILFTLLHPRLQTNKPKKNEIVADDHPPEL
ncbi:MAG: MraY family glycosyltransferase [Acidimicrobiales bacterium]|jgi:UDP-GlcNAc:undecaprenyl-phosphate GlcNAc-1-phosphate transferase|nr:undecaprenyl-phosphate alpha-N-acetylglucosaminyl 1-phosphate transferase [Acidimicrobiaceae bacterium]MDP6161571.1 MraY family glycosyltransferase [Acidimicrobiales bacterium]MDP6285083.1 MraY family glycosyltransferase [Acidimicrobiales bacterium]HJL90990.1 MraY family glycosyltransferase [Acidimicrobiales bacterium]HJO40312.1 MraY family glycosyltransferase [Acidimicrobiales bacterium]|tara:strand:- start:1283 stop:2431 length:1149 start_codon:yes stop_codon:yes gene_type:complete